MHASRSLFISLPSLHDHDVKLPNFASFLGDVNTRQRFSNFFKNLDKVLYRIQPSPEKFTNI